MAYFSMSATTISQLLQSAVKRLEAAGIATSRLDCLVLMEDEIGRDRSWILAHQDEFVSVKSAQRLNTKIDQRTAHEPLAYIRNKTEFYGRSFYIDHRVLEPRPESETMIDLLKTLPGIRDAGRHIADIGTGSGALAVTAKLELPALTVSASDLDPGCLQVASRNARLLRADLQFTQGNLLEPLAHAGDLHALLCNLPYVPDGFQINPAAMREPRLAIFGGPDGLDIYRKLFAQCRQLALLPRFILAEALPTQHAHLAAIASEHGFALRQTDDFIQLFSPAG